MSSSSTIDIMMSNGVTVDVEFVFILVTSVAPRTLEEIAIVTRCLFVVSSLWSLFLERKREGIRSTGGLKSHSHRQTEEGCDVCECVRGRILCESLSSDRDFTRKLHIKERMGGSHKQRHTFCYSLSHSKHRDITRQREERLPSFPFILPLIHF